MRQYKLSYQHQAQAMLEYLILVIFVAGLIFAALNFKKQGSVGNTLIEQTQNYYKQGYKMIVTGKTKPLDGGWCEWSSCINGYKERDCACPRPVLGGRNCAGPSYMACSGL